MIDDRERDVVTLWRRSQLSNGTMMNYLRWVRRFRNYCETRQFDETEWLTASRVKRFVRTYRSPRFKGQRSSDNMHDMARKALHAWSCALDTLGASMPLWREKQRAPLPPLLKEYCNYRRAHNGISGRTLIRDVDTARCFLVQLRDAKRSIKQVSLPDVDAFVQSLATRLARRTVADTCSSLRAFLRFLQITGRLPVDLASGVIAPRYRIDENPPRALPWNDVQRILRSISQSEAPGKRDFAMVLLLAAYGLGAAEVLGIRLQDLDWAAAVLRVRRPKTNVSIELPLLPAVARALIAYLRWERPPVRSTQHIFLRRNMPHKPITSAAIRYRIRHYACLAGVNAKAIGAHAFRHSHATRQIDGGANIKVVSEILGHRSTSSTSIYVRVALNRLRTVALPVPR